MDSRGPEPLALKSTAISSNHWDKRGHVKNARFLKSQRSKIMFTLNNVESGLLGFVRLVLLFVVSFWYSAKVLAKG
jgi:hypothetical protein